MTSTTAIEHCQKLADIACDLDGLKHHLSQAGKDRLNLIVTSLHDVAKSEAGPRVGEIYADEPTP